MNANTNDSLSFLLIDDDLDLAEALAEVLEALEHEIVVTHSGAGALEILQRRQDFDVILLDFRLPDGDASLWIEEIRGLVPDARVMVITGFVEDGVEDELRALQVHDLMIKPFSVHDLVARIGLA